jgi:hypothetical protein
MRRQGRRGPAVAEELRFFLRTAIYSIFIGTVYWFASYEVAGSVLLFFVVFSALSFVGVVAGFVPHSRDEIVPAKSSGLGSVGGALLRVLGFEEHHGSTSQEPLSAGLEPIPPGSWWPLIAGVATVLVMLGLVYGPWMLFPGIVLAAGTVWGWVTQMDVRS